MKKIPELLAPGGDIDSIKAAIAAGADAVYCGLNRFNARNRAENLSIENLIGIVHLAHKNNCKVFLALNIILLEAEIPAIISLLNRIVNVGLDAVIVQDFGLLCLLNEHFKSLKIHASTQLTTHNEGQILFLRQLRVNRVNLCRELNLNEITHLSSFAHSHDISTEVFVHGSHCLCFSGMCYMSSVQNGTSGNRGRCGQPCRDQYITTTQGKQYPLNLKDISTFFDLPQLVESKVDSLKIEGRIKKFHYVYVVVEAWRKQLGKVSGQNTVGQEDSLLHTIFNRGFSNGFLHGNIHKSMFTDNPRDNSARYLAEKNGDCTDTGMERAKRQIYQDRSDIIHHVKKKISHLKTCRTPVEIHISGNPGSPLKVSVKTDAISFNVYSHHVLVKRSSGNRSCGYGISKQDRNDGCLGFDTLQKVFGVINSSGYQLLHLSLQDLDKDLFLPFKAIKSLQRSVLSTLNGIDEFTLPMTTPQTIKQTGGRIDTSLSVLISSQKDIHLGDETNADIYFQLPDFLQNNISEYRDLLLNNPHISPVFPAILIGEHFTAAVDLLQQIRPQRVMTNNTGIAYYAWKMNIPWIAGPYLNLANSHGLLCLKKSFNCMGAFISNELSKTQIKTIRKPKQFSLFYSIYHPLLLMTSRQCLFHHVSGCSKERMDQHCIKGCTKSATLNNMQDETFYIKKNPYEHNCIYNNINFLNADIPIDIPEKFTSFFIDLRDITTDTAVIVDKAKLTRIFSELLRDTTGEKQNIDHLISPTTNLQYKKGI